MKIWDDIQKGLKGAASFTAKKTTELTDIAKVKYGIKTTESKLEKCFAEIGRLYFDSNKNGTEHGSEIATLIMQIEKLSCDIDTLKAELVKIKNTSVCAECGAEVSKECTFCPVCGDKLECECCDCECECDDDCECGCDCGCEEE